MMYGKPKAAKPKKPAPKKGMAMGGMASSPEALQTQRVATAMPGSAITTNDPKMLAAMQQFQASGQRPVTAPMQTASPVPLPKVKPRRSGSTPVRPSIPVKPKPAVRGYDKKEWATLQEKGFQDVMNNPKLTPEQKAQAQKDYTAQFGKLPSGMSKGGATKKGMAYGGMAKKGYNKGGMANCGASMKPAQGKGK
jgi:hypothetical protein